MRLSSRTGFLAYFLNSGARQARPRGGIGSWQLGARWKLDCPRLRALQIQFAPLSPQHFHSARLLTDLERVTTRSQRKNELSVIKSAYGTSRHVDASLSKRFDTLIVLWWRRRLCIALSTRCSDSPSHPRVIGWRLARRPRQAFVNSAFTALTPRNLQALRWPHAISIRCARCTVVSLWRYQLEPSTRRDIDVLPP